MPSPATGVRTEPMTDAHATDVLAIYQAGIEKGNAIASTEAAGIWTIQSGIFPENTASLALHQASGFRVVGTRQRIGRHRGRWRDVVLIERRSPAV